MSGSTDLTLEDEPTYVYEENEGYPYEEYEGYPTTIENIENEMDHNEHDLNNVSILKQILPSDNDMTDNYNEISHYLSINVRNDIDPFKWWNENKNNFLILTKLAKKYLCISATSVASERLFSDVGNIITAKRTNLKPERMGKMVFLKRNLKIVQPFS